MFFHPTITRTVLLKTKPFVNLLFFVVGGEDVELLFDGFRKYSKKVLPNSYVLVLQQHVLKLVFKVLPEKLTLPAFSVTLFIGFLVEPPIIV